MHLGPGRKCEKMNFLFWLFWVLDLLLLLLVIAGKGFRSGFGAGTDLNSWLTIALVVILIGSLSLKYLLKQPTLSLVMVALPMVGMFVAYIFEKKNSVG